MRSECHEEPGGGEALSRRNVFGRVADGLWGAALVHLLDRDLRAGTDNSPPGEGPRRYDTRPRPPHFPPRANAVIQLFMQGGPSQVDLFDPKPALEKYHGKPVPQELIDRVEGKKHVGGFLRSPFRFAQHGQSGIWVSDALPHLARCVDELTVIRSMYSTHVTHEPAIYVLQSGRMLPGLPTLGSWVVYGLGSENQNLPAYVVLNDPMANLPTNGEQNWQAGFLPPVYQGTRLRPTGAAVLNLLPEVKEREQVVQRKRDLLARLDEIHKRHRPGHLQLDARIASYELAARMQLEAPEALDLARESPATLAMYGVGQPKTDNYARRCLMARRLVERGVRFVQICTGHQIWDTHSHLERNLRSCCEQTDQPVAALLRDLRQRGLLESTLVLWSGEFGRTPTAEIRDGRFADAGRDHGPYGFTCWMAGGGVQRGMVYGATDEIGFSAVEPRVSVTDWHATILHLLGLHHDQLVFDRHGLKERLTSVFQPRIVKEILA